MFTKVTDENENVINYDSARNAAEITPSDAADLDNVTRGIYVGGAGDVKVCMGTIGAITFKDVPAGSILPIRTKRVYNTDTTATNLIALW